jgi:hypothetical protein
MPDLDLIKQEEQGVRDRRGRFARGGRAIPLADPARLDGEIKRKNRQRERAIEQDYRHRDDSEKVVRWGGSSTASDDSVCAAIRALINTVPEYELAKHCAARLTPN